MAPSRDAMPTPLGWILISALLAICLWAYACLKPRQSPESKPLLQETRFYSAPPPVAEELNLSHALGSLVIEGANTFTIIRNSTLQTFNPLTPESSVHFEVCVDKLPPGAELLIGFCPLTYTEDPSSRKPS